MSLQAYQKAAQRAENPREAEYRLFGEVTRALIDVNKTMMQGLEPRAEASAAA